MIPSSSRAAVFSGVASHTVIAYKMDTTPPLTATESPLYLRNTATCKYSLPQPGKSYHLGHVSPCTQSLASCLWFLSETTAFNFLSSLFSQVRRVMSCQCPGKLLQAVFAPSRLPRLLFWHLPTSISTTGPVNIVPCPDPCPGIHPLLSAAGSPPSLHGVSPSFLSFVHPWCHSPASG